MYQTLEATEVKVADETFIALALLHRENPGREDFLVSEIVSRARREGLHPTLRPGVQVHASLHCVANKPANSATYRMLFETAPSRRRLLLATDPVDPTRTGKIFPEPGSVPAPYRGLIEWAKARFDHGTSKAVDPGDAELAHHGDAGSPGAGGSAGLRRLLGLRGMGRGLWKPGEADEYVAGLRNDWFA